MITSLSHDARISDCAEIAVSVEDGAATPGGTVESFAQRRAAAHERTVKAR